MKNQAESNNESEMSKLSQILRSSEEEISFLNSIKEEDLEFLRSRIHHAIMEEQAGVWEPIARVSKFIPNFLNAKVSQDVLGPQITANITYHVPTRDALSIASYFSTSFFCDVLEHIIPEKIQHIIEESPLDLMRKAVHELRKRKNFILIGNLIDYTPISYIHKISIEVDDKDMVQILDHIQKRMRMIELLDLYEDAKIMGITKASLMLDKIDALKEIFEHAPFKAKEKVRKILTHLNEGVSFERIGELLAVV
jgi:hypothetical protein